MPDKLVDRLLHQTRHELHLVRGKGRRERRANALPFNAVLGGERALERFQRFLEESLSSFSKEGPL